MAELRKEERGSLLEAEPLTERTGAQPLVIRAGLRMEEASTSVQARNSILNYGSRIFTFPALASSQNNLRRNVIVHG